MVVAVIGVLVMAATGALAVVAAVHASHRAATAADLGALAGAQRWADFGDAAQACAEAGLIARANGATVTSCLPRRGPSGAVVDLTVVVPVASGLPWISGRAATATSRAGEPP